MVVQSWEVHVLSHSGKATALMDKSQGPSLKVPFNANLVRKGNLQASWSSLDLCSG